MRASSYGHSPLREAQVWGVAFAGMLLSAAYDTASRGHLPWTYRLAPLLVLLVACSGASATAVQALTLGLLGFAFFDGFLANAYGELTFDRQAGWPQLGTILGCALAAQLVAHHLTRRRRQIPADLRSSRD